MLWDMVRIQGAVKVDQQVEITDRESAQAWLETQDHQTRVWFAVRCALRTIPALGLSPLTACELAYASFRASLIACGAATCSRPTRLLDFDKQAEEAFKAASASARAARKSVRSTSGSRDGSAYSSSTYTSVSAVRSVYHFGHPHATDALFSATKTAPKEFTLARQADAEILKNWGPLWSSRQIPEPLAQGWKELKRQWEPDSTDWSFWIEWYEAILNGTPLPWELTQRIALEVTAAEWDAGQTVVAARIAEIRARFDTERHAADLEKQLTMTIDASDLAPRGHNNPPSLIEDQTLVDEVAALKRAASTLTAQAGSASPEKHKVEAALSEVSKWYNAVLAWLGRKGDLAVDTAIKWAIPAGGGYLVLNPNQLQKLIEAGNQWVPFLN